MLKKWLSWINMGVGGMIVLLLLAAFVMALIPTELALSDSTVTKRTLPKGAFAMPKQALDTIGATVLDLKFSPLPIQLPDLRTQLVYCGRNGRPDAPTDKTTLHLSLNGNSSMSTTLSGEPLYLQYDKKASSRYVFSPGNAKTSLWLEATSQGNEAHVKLYLKNENGEIIHEPATHAQFTLPERENMRMVGRTWDLGKWRVDGSLLARQKARWMGQDRFLEKHGGAEYDTLQGKHRVEFNDEEESYFLYVGLNDSLIWDDGRWKTVQPGQDSLKHPLLVVKRVEDRLMGFELWDIDGKGKITLNLVKTHETPAAAHNLETCFKCIGARTRSQYIFEIADQRVLLSPQDWILQTDEGWIKLTSAEEIDDYVNRKLTGVLFVFDGVGRNEERQVLLGTMFNPSRTEAKSVELPILQQPGARRVAVDSVDDKDKTLFSMDDYDDDEDEDDDDDEERKPVALNKKRMLAMKSAAAKKREVTRIPPAEKRNAVNKNDKKSNKKSDRKPQRKTNFQRG